jgi:hypothetical protein
VCPPVSARKPESADATLQTTQANGGILALAHNLETIHALPILTAASEHALQAVENGHSNHAPAGTLVEDAPAEHVRELSAKFVVEDAATPAQEAMLVLAEETLAIPVKETVDSLVRPLVESVELEAPTEPPASPEATVVGEPNVVETALVAAPVPEPEPVPETVAAGEPEVAILPTELLSEAAPAIEQPSRAEDVSDAIGTVEVDSPGSPLLDSVESEALVEQPAKPEATVLGEPEVLETALVAPPVPEPEPILESVAAAEPEVAILPAELLSEPAAAPEPAAESEQPSKTNEFSEAIGAVEMDSLPSPLVESVRSETRAEEPAKLEATVVGEPEVAILPAELLSESAAAREPAAESQQHSKTEELSEAVGAREVDSLASPLVESVRSETQADPSKPDVAPAEPEVAILSATPPEQFMVPEPQASQAELLSEPAAESTVAPELEAISEAVATGELDAAPTAEPIPLLELSLQSEPAAAFETPENEPVSVAEPEVVGTSNAQLTLELKQPSKLEGPELESPAVTAENEGAESPVVSAVEESAADPDEAAASREIFCALELQAEALVEAIGAELEADRAAVSGVVASFHQQSSTALLAAPNEIVTAPAPPIFESLRSPRPRLESLAPPPANLTALSAHPQPPTLAGPCLPRELRNPADSEIRKQSRKPGRLPGWVTSSIAATLLLLLAWTLLQYFGSQGDARASTPAGSQSASPGSAAAAQSEALAKSLEISGLRLVTSWNGKQQIRFLIVNHAPRELSGVTAQVTVKVDGSPILLIQAPIRSLGSNQSKEIRTDLDSDVPASTLSDWQSLRAEVHLTNKE